jgi:methionine aminopeptidase
MVSNMKTTIDIAEPVLEEARRLAARRGVTLRELVEEGLRRILEKEGTARPFRLRKATFKGQGLSADADGLSWERLRHLAYEGRGT